MPKERWLSFNIDVVLGLAKRLGYANAHAMWFDIDDEPPPQACVFPHDALRDRNLCGISDEPEEGDGSNDQSHEDGPDGGGDLLFEGCPTRGSGVAVTWVPSGRVVVGMMPRVRGPDGCGRAISC